MVTDYLKRAGFPVKTAAAVLLSVFLFPPGYSFCFDESSIWPQEYKQSEAPREVIQWRRLVSDLSFRLESDSAGAEDKVSFLNTPYRKFVKEDLIAYTVAGDGAVTVQMRDKISHIAVTREEALWFFKLLMEYGLADLPDEEPDDRESAEFRVSVRTGGKKKVLRLYNSRNGPKRDILWQYFYSFGLKLLQSADLMDRNKAVMPVCKGITGRQEIDSDNDGRVDWIKFRLEFYSFKSGDFVLGFGPGKTDLFLPPGNNVHYEYVNSYLLSEPGSSLADYSLLTVDTKPGNPRGPFAMKLADEFKAYSGRQNLRKTADKSCSGEESLVFKAGLNQSVILHIGKTESFDKGSVIRFKVKKIDGESVLVGNDKESLELVKDDKNLLHDLECVSCYLRLSRIEGSSAVFEAGWDIPVKEAVENKIRQYNEALTSDNFHGDKELARASLDAMLDCRECLENLDDIRIELVYVSPS